MAVALLAMPPAAGAVLSGENGRIVFTSGRGEANDTTARLFLRPVPFSTGGGTTSLTVTPGAGLGQHRHPTWSPDRTMIAYARGDNNCSAATSTNCAIYVLDLTDPNATPQAITGVDAIADDRPAWSPDGTRIAYETELSNGSGQLDVLVDTEPFGSGANLNLTGASADFDGKPAWTPDSQTIFYARDLAAVGVDNDIVSEPAGGGTVTPVIAGATDDYQPSVSPDGNELCFIRGAFGTNDAEVFTANINGTGVALFSYDDNVASYNCTWSPDGTTIAYADGAFSSGDLIIQTGSSGTGGLPIPIETTTARFDGNPDWAPDGRPGCVNKSATTTVGTPVTINVECPDSGPQYEQSSVTGFIRTPPGNGTTSPNQGDPAFDVPRSVTYTPNPGFLGTDTFEVGSFDDFGFGDDGTMTITVQRTGRTLTFDANKNKVKKGRKVTLSGDVGSNGNAGACEANQTVEIQRRKPSQASFTPFQQIQTDGAGGFILKTKVKKTFLYQAVLGENQTCEDATSNNEKVKAKKKKKKKKK